MDLILRVANRFTQAHFKVTAEALTKSWLMGVRRGFLSLLKPHIGDYDDVFRALDQLDNFVEGLKEQVRLVYRGPFQHTNFDGVDKRSVAIEAEFTRLSKQLYEARSTARHWSEWMDGTATGYKWGENRKPDAEHMLKQYQTNFADTIGGHVPTRVQRSKGKYNTTKFVDIMGFLDRILKMLYEEAKEIEELNSDGTTYTPESAYSEFDLSGMKVIVSDTSLGAYDINQYVKYLKEAHVRLKAKGFGKVWYGTVFIECDACGGVNKNDGGGVGGHFNIQKDWVKIFSRPSSFIVELMAHELGHRHWFKGMSSGQRARFESLVKVQRKPKLRPIDEAQIYKAIDLAENSIDDVATKAKEIAKSGNIEGLYWKVSNDLLAPLKKVLRDHSVTRAILDGTAPQAAKDLRPLEDAAQKSLVEIEEWARKAYDFGGNKPKNPGGLESWLMQMFDRTREAKRAVIAYFEAIQEASTPGFDPKDTRTVLPVSEYGSSNIDEAFAEVFMQYIMGEDLNRDQLESFKSVFSSVEESLVDISLHRTTETL
jgi:hypothetical protein